MSAAPTVLAVVQARMSSSRLPGKVLADLAGAPMILRQLERSARARRIGAQLVATSAEPSDDPLAATLEAAGIRVHRGPLNDVLGRYVVAVQAFEAAEGPVGHVVRLTADCPLIDPEIIDEVIALHLQSGADYTSNAFDRSFADGLDVEILARPALARLAQDAQTPEEREHVTLGIARRRGAYRVEQLVQVEDQSALRWTVDTAEDLAFVRRVYAALFHRKPDFASADIHGLGAAFERYAV